MAEWVRPYAVALPLGLLFASLIAAESRLLRWSTLAYAVQGWLMALLVAASGWMTGNESLLIWAALVVLSKGLLIPWLLGRYVPKRAEAAGPGLSLSWVGAVLAAAIAFFLADRFGPWVLAGLPSLTALGAWSAPGLAQVGLIPGGLQAAAAVLALGSWAALAHRDLCKSVIGLCLVENGVHLALVSLAPSLPETGEIGIMTDVVLSVWLLLLVARQVPATTEEMRS